MTIKKEISLRDFEFWAGAKQWADVLTPEELDRVEWFLDDCADEWTETEINDFLWFNTEEWMELLGVTEDELLAREK
jgi:hypothetical protein